MVGKRLDCQKCGRKFNMIVNGTCFFCNKVQWTQYFEKQKKDK